MASRRLLISSKRQEIRRRRPSRGRCASRAHSFACGNLWRSGPHGSIEKGKIANLLVTDGDLFAEKTKIKNDFRRRKENLEFREPDRPKDPPKGDLTGKWTLKYTTPEGDEESTADLTMSSDGTLSGTLASKLASPPSSAVTQRG